MPAGSFARFARRKKVKAETHPDSCTTTHSPRERVSRNGFNLHSDCTMLRICCVPTGVVGSGAFAAFSLWFWGLVPDSQDRALSVRRKSLGAGGAGATSLCNAREAVAINTHSTRHTRIQVFKCVPCTLLVRVGMSMSLLLHYV